MPARRFPAPTFVLADRYFGMPIYHRGPPGIHLNHVFTPLCPEHAPRCCFAKLYVPSLHCAVASWGALAGGSCVRGVTGGGRFVVASGGLAGDRRSAPVDCGALGVVASWPFRLVSANQSAIPPWPEHAPRLVAAVV